MKVFGILAIIVGILLMLYGYNLNHDLITQLYTFFNNLNIDLGDICFFIGIGVLIVGVMLFLIRPNQKKLYRSQKDVKISGVCGGISEYTNIDSTFVRLIWVVASIVWGVFPGILLYIICAIFLPKNPGYLEGEYYEKE